MLEVTLKKVRVDKGMSLRDLSKITNISISQLSKIENNLSIPKVDTLWALSKALNVRFDNLINGD